MIIGGGVAGCATAMVVKQSLPNASVANVERSQSLELVPSAPRIGETLPPHTVVQFQQLGLWESFNACGFLPAHGTCAAWVDELVHHNEFIFSPYGHGWHLDRRAFDQWMMTGAEERGVVFFSHCQLISQEYDSDGRNDKDKDCDKSKGWSFRIQTGKIEKKQNEVLNFSCGFVVDTTGRHANFAQQQGATKIPDDQLVGVFRFYQLEGDETEADSAGLI